MEGMRRSYLYVSGIDTERMAIALITGADAIMVDLEDAVPAHLKTVAKETVRAWADGLGEVSKEIWIRVNSGEEGMGDLAELRGCPQLTGFVLAKADLRLVRRAVDAVAGADLQVVPLLETATAVLDARRIAEAGVQHLEIGEYDLCADVGITPREDEAETAWARGVVVFASRSAGLMPPVAPVSIEIRDEQRFAESTRRAARQGFVGRVCIHPRQVEVVNDIFTPTAGEIASAQETLERFEAPDDGAVMVDGHGRLVDKATVRLARRTLELADVSAGSRSAT
jgi:citrate lyase subunit beta/citryl-CoA lyase